MTILLVVAILVILIIAHELGHFLIAKLVGVKVEEFGLGYPPRALTLGKWGETEYTLNWLPFGGFVKLYGEDASKIPRNERRFSLVGTSHWQQALVLVAGVAANVLVGWLLFASALMIGTPVAVPEGTPGSYVSVRSVVTGSPAADAGMQSGDRIIAVSADDGAVAEVSPSTVAAFVQAHGGQEITVTYERNGTQHVVDVTPAHAVLQELEGKPALGVQLATLAVEKLSVGEALVDGARQTVFALGQVAVGLWGLVTDAFQGSADLSQIVGPVGLVNVVGGGVGYGWGYILGIAAFISVNLAIINLLPIPALDGGRLLFVAIEGLTRRQVPPIIVHTLNMLGFALIILLMLVVTFHDIARII